MFGFSVAKILVILLAIVGVIVAVRLFRSVQRGGGGGRGRVTGKGRRSLPKEGDLTECPACGDFVDAQAGACGRGDCPQ